LTTALYTETIETLHGDFSLYDKCESVRN